MKFVLTEKLISHVDNSSMHVKDGWVVEMLLVMIRSNVTINNLARAPRTCSHRVTKPKLQKIIIVKDDHNVL